MWQHLEKTAARQTTPKTIQKIDRNLFQSFCNMCGALGTYLVRSREHFAVQLNGRIWLCPHTPKKRLKQDWNWLEIKTSDSVQSCHMRLLDFSNKIWRMTTGTLSWWIEAQIGQNIILGWEKRENLGQNNSLELTSNLGRNDSTEYTEVKNLGNSNTGPKCTLGLTIWQGRVLMNLYKCVLFFRG